MAQDDFDSYLKRIEDGGVDPLPRPQKDEKAEKSMTDRLIESLTANPSEQGKVCLGSSVTIRFDDVEDMILVLVKEIPTSVPREIGDAMLLSEEAPIYKAIANMSVGKKIPFRSPNDLQAPASVIEIISVVPFRKSLQANPVIDALREAGIEIL